MIDNNLIYNEIIEHLKKAASDNESLQLTPEEVKILAEELGDYACVPLVTGEELMELIREKTDR